MTIEIRRALRAAAAVLALLPALAFAAVEPPQPLSVIDAERYRTIFAVQERGRWAAADREIAKLENRVLMGHVLAQRYLHPTAYRSRFHELRDWMRHYRDHPDAERIYKLALKRRPSGAARPYGPLGDFLDGFGGDVTSRDVDYRPEGRSRAQRNEARRLTRIVNYRLRRGWPTGASEILESRQARRVFTAGQHDELWAEVAGSFFFAGDDTEAYRVGARAGARSNQTAPLAHWYAGLAAWRMQNYADARTAFEAAARSRAAGDWTRSAAAFWAARANLRTGRPDRVSGWLVEAASSQRTLYGQLAAEQLGMDRGLDFEAIPASATDFSDLARERGGLRALALMQAGETHRAERELRGLWTHADPGARRGIMAVAMASDMAALSMYLGWVEHRETGRVYDAALYPTPDFAPRDGFSIDRALIFAIMRQESAFLPRARSHAGARGLMQVMPATARAVARRENIPGVRRSTMFTPDLNMQLGQAYIEMMLKEPAIENTLFHVVAAYNAGPGNVQKWERRARHGGDPLLFVESIPFSETRDYVKKVVSNMWIYRARYGQRAPSLEAVAANIWPQYEGQDGGDQGARARAVLY